MWSPEGKLGAPPRVPPPQVQSTLFYETAPLTGLQFAGVLLSPQSWGSQVDDNGIFSIPGFLHGFWGPNAGLPTALVPATT